MAALYDTTRALAARPTLDLESTVNPDAAMLPKHWSAMWMEVYVHLTVLAHSSKGTTQSEWLGAVDELQVFHYRITP